eukprot:5750577-Pyramimonas_sp.AAC.1
MRRHHHSRPSTVIVHHRDRQIYYPEVHKKSGNARRPVFRKRLESTVNTVTLPRQLTNCDLPPPPTRQQAIHGAPSASQL